MPTEAVLVMLFKAIAELVPGLLKAMAGTYSDEQAIERARAAYRAIPTSPAASAIDAHEKGEP